MKEHIADISRSKGFFPILRTVTTPDEVMQPENAGMNMIAMAEQVFEPAQLHDVGVKTCKFNV